MSKAIRRRVERLEESLGPDESPSQNEEDIGRRLKMLDNWPYDFLSKNPNMPQSDEEIANLRAACRKLAGRVRAGELTTKREVLGQLPSEALLGLLSYIHRRRNAD